MQLHDLLAQRQPQPGAAFLAAYLHKGLEDAPLLPIGNALAVVLDADDDPLRMPPGMQTDTPAIGGMADGVVQQVVKHPVQLGGIGLKARQRRLW